MTPTTLATFDLRVFATVKMSFQTTIDLLDRPEKHNPDKPIIHVILDRAPVHRGEAARISLHFLPACAPSLNAIERLWKLMHEHVTRNS